MCTAFKWKIERCFMKDKDSQRDLLEQRLMAMETFADLIKTECYKLRDLLGRFYAPASINDNRSKHYSSISKALQKRQLTMTKRKDQ
jgi:hypothetical protein